MNSFANFTVKRVPFKYLVKYLTGLTIILSILLFFLSSPCYGEEALFSHHIDTQTSGYLSSLYSMLNNVWNYPVYGEIKLKTVVKWGALTGAAAGLGYLYYTGQLSTILTSIGGALSMIPKPPRDEPKEDLQPLENVTEVVIPPSPAGSFPTGLKDMYGNILTAEPARPYRLKWPEVEGGAGNEPFVEYHTPEWDAELPAATLNLVKAADERYYANQPGIAEIAIEIRDRLANNPSPVDLDQVAAAQSFLETLSTTL